MITPKLIKKQGLIGNIIDDFSYSEITFVDYIRKLIFFIFNFCSHSYMILSIFLN